MKKILVACAFTMFALSCGNITSEIKEMRSLQETIEKRFGFKDISMKIVNGQALEISVLNSSYNDSSDDARQRMADSIGSVCSGYMHDAKLTKGTVAFAKGLSGGLINASESKSYPMHLSN